jgi:hypothetical protein
MRENQKEKEGWGQSRMSHEYYYMMSSFQGLPIATQIHVFPEELSDDS